MKNRLNLLVSLLLSGAICSARDPFEGMKTDVKTVCFLEKGAATFGKRARKGVCHEGVPKDASKVVKLISEGDLKALKVLSDTNKDLLTQKDSNEVTPLHWAAFFGHLEIVEYVLVHSGTDVNAADSKKWTPLHYAVCQGHDKVVAYLLKKGARRKDRTNQDAGVWILATDRAVLNVLEEN